MNLSDPADFMRRKMAAKKDDTKPAIATPKPEATEPDGDEQQPGDEMQINLKKKPEGGYHRTIDNKDGFPADESDHDSISDAMKLNDELEAKFGESAVENAEEEIDPGIHEKVAKKLEGEEKPKAASGSGFLSKFSGGEQ